MGDDRRWSYYSLQSFKYSRPTVYYLYLGQKDATFCQSNAEIHQYTQRDKLCKVPPFTVAASGHERQKKKKVNHHENDACKHSTSREENTHAYQNKMHAEIFYHYTASQNYKQTFSVDRPPMNIDGEVDITTMHEKDGR